MKVLLKRNMKLYFRDKRNLSFSLLAIVIILILYIVFLGNVWGNTEIRSLPEYYVLRHNWLTAGKLTVATITTSMGALGVMIDDRTKKIYKGFYASPVKRWHITGGYILNAFCIGVIMTLTLFIPLTIYSAILGGTPLTIFQYLKTLGLVLLISFSNTAMVCFIITSITTRNAFSTASSIVGTLIGFLLGIYLPIGELPNSVQTVMKLFPPSHGAALLRQVLMRTSIQTSFYGIPTNYVEEFRELMGVALYFGNFEVTALFSIAMLIVSAAIFYGLTLLNMRKVKV
ncbi:MAG: ABC transporter permease [Firmicutes bacterium]|nr:ABC transporter permease [Bacillota bacterium]